MDNLQLYLASEGYEIEREAMLTELKSDCELALDSDIYSIFNSVMYWHHGTLEYIRDNEDWYCKHWDLLGDSPYGSKQEMFLYYVINRCEAKLKDLSK